MTVADIRMWRNEPDLRHSYQRATPRTRADQAEVTSMDPLLRVRLMSVYS